MPDLPWILGGKAPVVGGTDLEHAADWLVEAIEVPPNLISQLNQFAQDFLKSAKETYEELRPKGYEPNNFANTLNVEVDANQSAGHYIIRLTSSSPYAVFVVGGTEEHSISVKRAKWLKWTSYDGQIHWAKEVNHPRQEPNTFGQLAAQRVLSAYGVGKGDTGGA